MWKKTFKPKLGQNKKNLELCVWVRVALAYTFDNSSSLFSFTNLWYFPRRNVYFVRFAVLLSFSDRKMLKFYSFSTINCFVIAMKMNIANYLKVILCVQLYSIVDCIWVNLSILVTTNKCKELPIWIVKLVTCLSFTLIIKTNFQYSKTYYEN